MHVGISPSEAGKELLRTLAPALRDIEGGLERLLTWRDSTSGTVRITTVRHAYETIIRPVLPQLSRDFPEVTVEVLIDYSLRDIVAERLDAGIRLGEMVEKDMIAVRVGPDLRMAAVASPGYVEKWGAPRTPRDLAGHQCINYRLMGSQRFYAWEFEKNGEALDVHVAGQLTFNEPDTMLGAALDGLGIAYVFEDQIQSHVVDGSLVRLLEDWTPPFPGFHLYYPSRRQTPPALAALIAALRRRWASTKKGHAG